MKTDTATRLPPLYRASINWARLYQEGLRMQVTAGSGEVSVFLVPFDADRDLVVTLIPCRKMIGGEAHVAGAHLIGLARHIREILRWVGLGRMIP